MEEARKKRLLYRAHYRGFKEADLILSGFIKSHIDVLSDEELLQFEHLLEAKDHDIYDWITGKQPVPSQYDTPIFERVKTYRP